MSSPIESLKELEQALDEKTGQPGAGAKVTAGAKGLPAKFYAIAVAIRRAHGSQTPRILATSTATATHTAPVSAPAPAPKAAQTRLEEYEALIADNRSGEAGELYDKHGEEIRKQNSARHKAHVAAIQALYGKK